MIPKGPYTVLSTGSCKKGSNDPKESLKRGLAEKISQQEAKRQKTTTTTGDVTNRHLCSNTTNYSPSLSLNQKIVYIENGQLANGISPFHGISQANQDKMATTTKSDWNVDEIKNDYTKYASSARYYQDALKATSKEEVAQIDNAEVIAVLGGVHGNAWWIRKHAYGDKEHYVGFVYSDMSWDPRILLTDDDLIKFFNGKDPTLHLEALREGKINKIRNDYVTFSSSVRYYQDTLQAAVRGVADEIIRIDTSEVQTILGGIHGDAWWFRKDIYNGQEYFAGITYSNNTWKYSTLATNNDFDAFCNGKNPALHLEVLREGKVNKIKSDYALFSSSMRYYQDVLEAASIGATNKVMQLDNIEVVAVLDGVHGHAWWVRKDFHANRETYVGITYSNGIWCRDLLCADNDFIVFFNGKNPALHLEALRGAKVNKIKSDYELFSSSIRYYQDVLQAAFRGAANEMAQLDHSEAVAVLGNVHRDAWWIRKDFVANREIYVGITYSNGILDSYLLFTDNDLVAFCNGKDPVLHLEALRKVNKIENAYAIFFSSVRYYQDTLQAAFRGAIDEVNRMDTFEVQSVLGGINGDAWWIRKSVINGQECYIGITYSSDVWNYCRLPTNNDLLTFFNGKNPALHLEMLRGAKVNKIKNDYAVFSSSVRYYQDTLQAAFKGRLYEMSLMDTFEVQSVLDGIHGDAWWIRKTVMNGLEYFMGITYSSEVWNYCLLSTNSDLLTFFNEKNPALHLEALRKTKLEDMRKTDHFGPLKNLPKELYDVLDAQYTLESNTDEKYNVLYKTVRAWIILVHPDKIQKKTDEEIKKIFQERLNLYIDDKTLQLIKEGEIIKILNVFMEKNK